MTPLPRVRPYRERLGLRVDMTIAAAIRCSDGIIFCADTELSSPDSKSNKQKIFTWEHSLCMTGAGDYDMLRMAFDKMCEIYTLGVPPNASFARQTAETVVTDLYKDHFFCYESTDPERPSGLSLIVGTRCGDGTLALIKTNATRAFMGGYYESCGSGQALFEYWAEYFYRDNLSAEVMSYLALFMLREAKKHGLFCGGTSQVFRMESTVKQLVISRVFYESDLLVGFPDSIVQILSVLTDPTVPDSWIEAKLNEFSESVMEVRASLKQRDETDARMRMLADFAHSKRSDSQTKEGQP
jgi:20S proteasome alpha/beta subunit